MATIHGVHARRENRLTMCQAVFFFAPLRRPAALFCLILFCQTRLTQQKLCHFVAFIGFFYWTTFSK